MKRPGLVHSTHETGKIKIKIKNYTYMSYRHGTKSGWEACSLYYQSEVSILGPVGYGPTTLPLRHSDVGVRFEDFT